MSAVVATNSSGYNGRDATAYALPRSYNHQQHQSQRGFSLRVFKQPTLSFFPYAASGQFDLGYGPDVTQPEAIPRQSSRSYTAQPQPRPSDMQSASSNRPGHGSHYTFPSTHEESTTRAAADYSGYTSSRHDTYAYDRSTGTTYDNSDLDAASDETAFSPTTSLLSTDGDVKTYSYEDRPSRKTPSSNHSSIPTFYNVSAHSQTSSGSSVASDSTLVSSSSRPNARESAYGNANQQFPSRRRSESISRQGSRASGGNAVVTSPVDTGSPWGRYSQDDIEAAYAEQRSGGNVPRRSNNRLSQIGYEPMFAQPGTTPVVYDEPEEQPEQYRSASDPSSARYPQRRSRRPSTGQPTRASRPLSTSSDPPSFPENISINPQPSQDYFSLIPLSEALPDLSTAGRRASMYIADGDLSQSFPPRSRRNSTTTRPAALNTLSSTPSTQQAYKYPCVTPVVSLAENRGLSPSRQYSDPSSISTTNGVAYSNANDQYNPPPRERTLSSSRTNLAMSGPLLRPGESYSYHASSANAADAASNPSHMIRTPSLKSRATIPNCAQPQRPSYHDRTYSEAEVARSHRAAMSTALQPQRRHSDGEVPTTHMELQRARSVRWNENLICPSPILPHQRRKGWFNRRGDQLWTNNGIYKPANTGEEYPVDLDIYPDVGQGWMNEEGVFIDVHHRLVPKLPLKSALKRRSG